MRGQKGITLIALIITIIVMLILVAVSISIVINSGLLQTAKDAGANTKAAYQNESNIDDTITVKNGTESQSVKNFIEGIPTV